MPRISNSIYLERHKFLAHAWEHYQVLFSVLRPTEQRELHCFYATTKSLDRLDPLRHRKAVTKSDPSLPHRTGKSFVRV